MTTKRAAQLVYQSCVFCGGLVVGATLVASVTFAAIGEWGMAAICLTAFVGMILVLVDTKG